MKSNRILLKESSIMGPRLNGMEFYIHPSKSDPYYQTKADS
jgi:hypothetical protein